MRQANRFLITAMLAVSTGSLAAPPGESLVLGVEALPTVQAKTTTISGKRRWRLDEGDFLHPVFSPDGRYLAFTRVVLRGTTELAEAGYLDRRTGKRVILLGADKMSDFAVYKAFVYNIQWRDARRLEFWISDGDVDSTIVTFEIPSNKKLAQRDSGADDESMPTAEHVKLAKQFAGAFPEIRDHLPDMFQQAERVSASRWVFQKNYSQQDNHVWMVDAATGDHRVLIRLPEKNWHYGLRGAMARGDDLALVLGNGGMVYVLLVDKKGMRIVDRFAAENYQSVYTNPTGDPRNPHFVVHTEHVRTRSPARLYHWTRDGIRRLSDGTEIIEADVSRDGAVVALVSWQGEKRVIDILEMKGTK